MTITRNIPVPTGNILIVNGEYGPLECLSIGDYGKDKNLKADFMGLSREINGVPHGELLPLEKKWVITISSQYGCSMGCRFCDVPKVGPGKNATFDDLIGQVLLGLSLHPEVKHSQRVNVHYARMGEPTFNENVVRSAYYLAGMFEEKGWGFHPVLSTILPDSPSCVLMATRWIQLKNCLSGNAGLQLSVNTTDTEARRRNMPKAMSISNASGWLNDAVDDYGLTGRKITLNIALTDDPVDAKVLRSLFDPAVYLIKITPMHMTHACKRNSIVTKDGYEQYYPYKDVEEACKAEGFDVIVFIPSREEDESRITCGNAILSGTKPGEE